MAQIAFHLSRTSIMTAFYIAPLPTPQTVLLTFALWLFYAVLYGAAKEGTSRRIPDVRRATRAVW